MRSPDHDDDNAPHDPSPQRTENLLDDQSQMLDVEALRQAFGGLRLGSPLIYFPELGSTNSTAIELARAGAAEGTLVLTDRQMAGRGRVGRHWEPLPGQQLTLSLVLRPPFAPHWLVMASALAVGEAAEAVSGVRSAIKWPNDVLIDSRKVAGILIESSADYVVLGIGLNVNGSLAAHPTLAERATTLAQVAGHPLSREMLVVHLLRTLDLLYADLLQEGEDAQQRLRAAWRAGLVTLGQPVTIQQGDRVLRGLAEDVTADGALLVRDAAGVQHVVTWGDVESAG